MTVEPVYIGTCDAGDCDELTEAIVLTGEGWLSMCKHHAIQQMERACCHLHGLNCEPPSELCCSWCTEAHHGMHICAGLGLVASHHDGSPCALLAAAS